MTISIILKLKFPKQFVPSITWAHTATCPTRPRKTPICDGSKDSAWGKGPKRAIKCGKVRMGFIPDEWFLFLHSKTGVSGPYILGIAVINYLFSKEIYVMEHEYYGALSILPMLYYGSTRFGPLLGKALDKEVDDFANALEKGRKDERSVFEQIIKDSQDAQSRAQGQKMLMDAKKENIAMQLEAVYRERSMQLFLAVKGRMDYQVKLNRAIARIQQKWMIQWIIQNVKESITPDFQQAYLNKVIEDIAVIAGRAK